LSLVSIRAESEAHMYSFEERGVFAEKEPKIDIQLEGDTP